MVLEKSIRIFCCSERGRTSGSGHGMGQRVTNRAYLHDVRHHGPQLSDGPAQNRRDGDANTSGLLQPLDRPRLAPRDIMAVVVESPKVEHGLWVALQNFSAAGGDEVRGHWVGMSYAHNPSLPFGRRHWYFKDSTCGHPGRDHQLHGCAGEAAGPRPGRMRLVSHHGLSLMCMCLSANRPRTRQNDAPFS